MMNPPIALEHDPERDQWTLLVDTGLERRAAVLPATVVDALAERVTRRPERDMTARLIEMARTLKAQEPERPDLDRHQGHHLEVVARTWDQWDRHYRASRLLIGARLTSEALDD